MRTIFFYLLVSLFFSLNAFAAKYAATLVTAKGDVKILHAKSKKSKRFKSIRYEGKTTTYEKARVGKKVKEFDVVHVGPNGKAKVIYSNGDHFVIGPGSSVTMPGRKKGAKAPTLNMYYGKVRSMISKKGQLKGMRVRTKSAVAGVRGTDFFISDDGVEETKITVLRGKVAVKAKPTVIEKPKKVAKKKTTQLPTSLPEKGELPEPEKIETVKVKPTEEEEFDFDDAAVVQAGFSVKIETNEEDEKPKGEAVADIKEKPKVVVYESPKTELLTVQKASAVKIKPEELKKVVSAEVTKQIEKLEKQAATAVIEDIKVEDKALYEKIKDQDIKDVSEINTAVVSKLYQEAPKAAEVDLKLTEDDIDDIGGDDVYKKYFNIQ